MSVQRKLPEYIPGIEKFGYKINEMSFPFRIDNIHNEYKEEYTRIKVKFEENDSAILTIAPNFRCTLHFETADGINLENLRTIKDYFNFKIGVIPPLGPVEPKEELLTREHVQKSINTYLSPRHFRNQWYHDNTNFDLFVDLLQDTWPEMGIDLPEIGNIKDLVMLCSENRMTREISWAGCGFQVWAQILSHLVRNKGSSTIIIDEPEIYLHPDLQRKFVTISKNLGPQMIIATHSVEMINEADISDVLIIDKNNKNAKRLNDSKAIQNVVDLLGSVQNMHLTRLLKNKKILFLEGNDYSILKKLAAKIKLNDLANGNGITVVPMGGFSHWPMVKNAEKLFQTILNEKINIAIILDRDYRCDEELEGIKEKISDTVNYLHFWERKEIENYLINIDVIKKIVEMKLKRRNRLDLLDSYDKKIDQIFKDVCLDQVDNIVGAYTESIFNNRKNRKHLSEISTECSREIRIKMDSIDEVLKLIPGKHVLANLSTEFQKEFGVSLTNNEIIKFTKIDDVSNELIRVLNEVNKFRLGEL